MIWQRGRTTEHQRVQELFSAYLDGELNIAEREQVEAHLRGCAPCTGDLEMLRQTVDLVRRLPAVPLPRDFSRGLVPVRPVGREYAVLRGATALAAAAFVCLLSVDVGSRFLVIPGALAPSVTEEVPPPAGEPYLAAEAPTPYPPPFTPLPEATPMAEMFDRAVAAPSPTSLPVLQPEAAPSPTIAISPLRALEILTLATAMLLGGLAWRRRAR